MSKMLDEIRQQPEALERTLRSGLRAARRFRKRLAGRRPRLIILTARGTSDNAAHFGRYLLEITTGIPVSLSAPSVFTMYGATVDLKDTLVVAVSQSGESTDINLVLERAAEHDAFTAGITNESGSTLAHLTHELFLVRAGKERSVAATKTYTGQLLMFYLLAYALGAPIDLEDLHRIPDWAAAALNVEPQVREVVNRYRFMTDTVVVGRGLNYASALEFALKLKETCYVVAEGFSAADFLHGPIAMVEESFPVMLFGAGGPTWPSMRQMIEKLHAQKAETLVITDKGNREAPSLSRTISLPLKFSSPTTQPSDLYTPIPYILPAQTFAAVLAEEKGHNPDRPRALSKVTLTM
ncbi:MAG: SIS domain-containing protein [Bryobacteraceae bacterium]